MTPLPGHDLLAVHANPRNVDDPIQPDLSDGAIDAVLGPAEFQVLAFGHVHIPSVRLWRGRLLVNVASAGLSMDGDPRAAYSVLAWAGGGWRVAQYRVEYDVQRVAREMQRNRPAAWAAFCRAAGAGARMIEPATPITRWQQFYSDDPGIAAIQPTQCVQWAVEQFRQRGAAGVLDLGCGAGRDTAVLAQHLPLVIGVDAAEAGLALAGQQMILRERRVPLVQADARALPFRPASFDGIYCFGLLHEFTGAHAGDDVQRTLDTIYAVLKPGGLLILAVLAGEPEQGLPQVRMFTEAMLLAATQAFCCVQLTTLEDVGCTGSAHYTIHRGVFLRERR